MSGLVLLPILLPPAGAAAPAAPSTIAPGSTSPYDAAEIGPSETFSWTSVSGAAGYFLYMSKSPYGQANIILTRSTTGTSIVITKGEINWAGGSATEFRWGVTAYNSAGEESTQSPNVRYFLASNQAPICDPESPAETSTANVGQTITFRADCYDYEGQWYAAAWDDDTGPPTSQYYSGPSSTTWSPSQSYAWSTTGRHSVSMATLDMAGAESNYVTWYVDVVSNTPPNAPSTPSGVSSGTTGVAYAFSTTTTDPEGDPITYTFDWGDGTVSTTNSVTSGTTASKSHSWSNPGSYCVRAKATDSSGASSAYSSCRTVEIASSAGSAPSTPAPPTGAATGTTGAAYWYSTSATDPDGQDVRITFDWGDGTSDESGPVASGAVVSTWHMWASAGTYCVRAKATDSGGAASAYSECTQVAITAAQPGAPFAPSTPTGPTDTSLGMSSTYSTSGWDPDGDQIRYCFQWGDGSSESCTPFGASGAVGSASHTWTAQGSYCVRAYAQDRSARIGPWSGCLTVEVSILPAPIEDLLPLPVAVGRQRDSDSS